MSTNSAESAIANRDQTILELLPLVHSTLNTLKCPIPDGYTKDDLVQEGTIGLIKAVDSFDPEHGATLHTWAARCIENAIRSCIRAASKTVPTVSFENCEFSTSVTDDTSAVELKITLQSTPLSPRSREILRLFLDEELSPAEIARRLNISRTHAGRLVKRAAELASAIADNQSKSL